MTRFVISFLLLSLAACGQTTTKQDPSNYDSKAITGWEELNKANYSVRYPSAWELNEGGQMGTSFILLSALESDTDKFRENINLLIQDLPRKDIDLDKYTEISEGQVKTIATNAVLIESKRMKNDDAEYHKLIYTADQGIYHLEFEQYYWVIKQKAYVLTLTCEKDKFDDFKETGEEILNTFKLKK